MTYLDGIIQKMENNQVTLIGCSDIEIKEIENEIGRNLPECYVEFLRSMGKKTVADETQENWYFKYPGFQGSNVFYPAIKYLNTALMEQLEEDGVDLLLPENAFVFYDHQGYISAFFNLDEGENPAVYGYQEGYVGNSFPMLASTLSSFYERHLEGDKTLFKELE